MEPSAAPVARPRAPSALHRFAWRFFRGMLLMSLVVLVLFVGLQRRLIYHPQREPVLPAMAGPVADRLSNVSITTADGLTLQGWRVAPQPANAKSQRRLTIYFQGNAAHRGRRGKQFTMLSDLGNEVLIVDYRGYGENPGVPSEAGLREDARAAWKFATEDLKYRPDEIVLFGESLGGGVATGLAAELCNSGVTPGGLILRATFTSLVDAGRAHYPFLPVNWVLIDRYPSEDRLPRIACPILVLHGDQDRIIPYSHGERLFAAAPQQSSNGVPKQFVCLHGAGHNDILYVAEREVQAALDGFYQRLP